MMTNIINKTFNLAISSLTTKSEEPEDPILFLQSIVTNENQTAFVCNYLEQIKRCFFSSSISQQHNYLTVIIYCANLGNENDAIKQTLLELGAIVMTFVEQSKSVQGKKLGYLALTSLINCGNVDLVYLSVNTILKDVTCKHKDIIAISLDAVSSIATVDIVPVILPVVEQRLTHSTVTVRIKAMRALHCLHKIGPEFMKHARKHVKLAISDHNPEVMAAALPYVYDILKNDLKSYEDLPPVLISILKQVVEGKLPVHMSFCGISAPFVQMLLLKILHIFPLDDDIKAQFADVLLSIMSHCQASKHRIANALLYECLHVTLTTFKEDEAIFKTAVHSLGTFLTTSDANLLSAGVGLLTQVAKITPSHCIQYQTTVLKCLTHLDPTIKKQTIILLQALINAENNKVICKHMISMLNAFADDTHFTKRLTENVAAIAEKFSSDLPWLLDTLHTLIEKSGDNTPESVCDRLITQLSKASSDQLDTELERLLALQRRRLSFHHFKTITLIMSKYLSDLKGDFNDNVKLVLKQGKSQFTSSNDKVRAIEVAFILTSFAKQVLFRCNNNSSIVEDLKRILPKSFRTSPTVYQFDGDFSFFEQFEGICDEEEQLSKEEEPIEVALKSQPYSEQRQPVVRTSTALMASMLMKPGPSVMGESFLSKEFAEEEAAVWGKEGYQRPQTNLSLNQALRNLSTVADAAEHDEAMLGIVNDVFGAADFTDKDSIASDNS